MHRLLSVFLIFNFLFMNLGFGQSGGAARNSISQTQEVKELNPCLALPNSKECKKQNSSGAPAPDFVDANKEKKPSQEVYRPTGLHLPGELPQNNIVIKSGNTFETPWCRGALAEYFNPDDKSIKSILSPSFNWESFLDNYESYYLTAKAAIEIRLAMKIRPRASASMLPLNADPQLYNYYCVRESLRVAQANIEKVPKEHRETVKKIPTKRAPTDPWLRDRATVGVQNLLGEELLSGEGDIVNPEDPMNDYFHLIMDRYAKFVNYAGNKNTDLKRARTNYYSKWLRSFEPSPNQEKHITMKSSTGGDIQTLIAEIPDKRLLNLQATLITFFIIYSNTTGINIDKLVKSFSYMLPNTKGERTYESLKEVQAAIPTYRSFDSQCLQEQKSCVFEAPQDPFGENYKLNSSEKFKNFNDLDTQIGIATLDTSRDFDAQLKRLKEIAEYIKAHNDFLVDKKGNISHAGAYYISVIKDLILFIDSQRTVDSLVTSSDESDNQTLMRNEIILENAMLSSALVEGDQKYLGVGADFNFNQEAKSLQVQQKIMLSEYFPSWSTNKYGYLKDDEAKRKLKEGLKIIKELPYSAGINSETIFAAYLRKETYSKDVNWQKLLQKLSTPGSSLTEREFFAVKHAMIFASGRVNIIADTMWNKMNSRLEYYDTSEANVKMTLRPEDKKLFMTALEVDVLGYGGWSNGRLATISDDPEVKILLASMNASFLGHDAEAPADGQGCKKYAQVDYGKYEKYEKQFCLYRKMLTNDLYSDDFPVLAGLLKGFANKQKNMDNPEKLLLNGVEPVVVAKTEYGYTDNKIKLPGTERFSGNKKVLFLASWKKTLDATEEFIENIWDYRVVPEGSSKVAAAYKSQRRLLVDGLSCLSAESLYSSKKDCKESPNDRALAFNFVEYVFTQMPVGLCHADNDFYEDYKGFCKGAEYEALLSYASQHLLKTARKRAPFNVPQVTLVLNAKIENYNDHIEWYERTFQPPTIIPGIFVADSATIYGVQSHLKGYAARRRFAMNGIGDYIWGSSFVSPFESDKDLTQDFRQFFPPADKFFTDLDAQMEEDRDDLRGLMLVQQSAEFEQLKALLLPLYEGYGELLTDEESPAKYHVAGRFSALNSDTGHDSMVPTKDYTSGAYGGRYIYPKATSLDTETTEEFIQNKISSAHDVLKDSVKTLIGQPSVEQFEESFIPLLKVLKGFPESFSDLAIQVADLRAGDKNSEENTDDLIKAGMIGAGVVAAAFTKGTFGASWIATALLTGLTTYSIASVFQATYQISKMDSKWLSASNAFHSDQLSFISSLSQMSAARVNIEKAVSNRRQSAFHAALGILFLAPAKFPKAGGSNSLSIASEDMAAADAVGSKDIATARLPITTGEATAMDKVVSSSGGLGAGGGSSVGGSSRGMLGDFTTAGPTNTLGATTPSGTVIPFQPTAGQTPLFNGNAALQTNPWAASASSQSTFQVVHSAVGTTAARTVGQEALASNVAASGVISPSVGTSGSIQMGNQTRTRPNTRPANYSYVNPMPGLLEVSVGRSEQVCDAKVKRENGMLSHIEVTTGADGETVVTSSSDAMKKCTEDRMAAIDHVLRNPNASGSKFLDAKILIALYNAGYLKGVTSVEDAQKLAEDERIITFILTSPHFKEAFSEAAWGGKDIIEDFGEAARLVAGLIAKSLFASGEDAGKVVEFMLQAAKSCFHLLSA